MQTLSFYIFFHIIYIVYCCIISSKILIHWLPRDWKKSLKYLKMILDGISRKFYNWPYTILMSTEYRQLKLFKAINGLELKLVSFCVLFCLVLFFFICFFLIFFFSFLLFFLFFCLFFVNIDQMWEFWKLKEKIGLN